MKKCLILIAVATALAVAGYGQTAADHIKAGDEAYAQFDDQKALEHYQEAIKLEPQNYEALWKASRACVDVADLLWFVDAFGSLLGDPAYDPALDFNLDGSIDVVDLLILVDWFGQCDP